MEAKELRIGNLLIFFNGIEPEKIITVGRRFFSSASVEKEDGNFQVSGYYKPIPLTEEWLLKFGFEKCDSPTEQGYTNGNCFMFQNSIGKFNFCLLRFGDFFKRIKYVHQLQNLYFALTGEEIELK